MHNQPQTDDHFLIVSKSWVYKHCSFAFDYFMFGGQLGKGQRIGMPIHVQSWKCLCAVSRAATCSVELRAGWRWNSLLTSYLIWKVLLKKCVVGWGDDSSLQWLVGCSLLQTDEIWAQLRHTRFFGGWYVSVLQKPPWAADVKSQHRAGNQKVVLLLRERGEKVHPGLFRVVNDQLGTRGRAKGSPVFSR